MHPFATECGLCGRDWLIDDSWRDEDTGSIVQPTQSCEYCEQEFCYSCFRRHECSGHTQELELCLYCSAEIDLVKGDVVVTIDGDKFCLRCGTEKPWEKRFKEAQDAERRTNDETDGGTNYLAAGRRR